jgi:hypothetical protein
VAVQQLAVTGPLSGLTGLPAPLLTGTGLFLIGYTALLLGMWRQSRVLPWLVALVVAGNGLWALGCIGLAASGAVPATGLGQVFLMAQTATVLAFAIWEAVGLKRSADGAYAPALRPAGAR